MKLTPKQERFVEEYLKDLNATQAAVRAGYSDKTAESQASRLLRNVKVRELVEARQIARSERTGITQDRVLQELELLAFSDLTHYLVDDNGKIELVAGAPDGAMRALQSVKHKTTTREAGEMTITTHEVELKLWDKPGPLKLAGQHVGLFIEKHEHTGKNGKPIEVVKRVVFGGRHKKGSDADSARG